MRISLRKPNPQLLPHLAAIAGIVMGTSLLALEPQVILHAGYRCEMQLLFGVRCPFCGMTRDFAAMLHGSHPGENPFSPLAAGIIYGLYPAAVFAGWRTGRLGWFHSAVIRRGLVVMLGVMLVVNNWH